MDSRLQIFIDLLLFFFWFALPLSLAEEASILITRAEWLFQQ